MVPPRQPLADITSRVKKNAYFQSAITDPASTSEASSQASPGGSLESAIDRSPSSVPIKVIVGADPISQRTWYLPEALLMRHSTLIASILENESEKIITLAKLDPRDFSNFVDYMRSSIYSVNAHVPEYSALRTHARSCLLGAAVGAEEYCNAALRQLHALFLPCANDRRSSASKSCIRASDMAFICSSTPSFPPPYYFTPAEGDSLTGLRLLFFDAMASHWTQRDIVQTGAQDKNPDTVKWQDVYHQNIDFRAAIFKTLQTWDGPLRSAFLKTVGTYIRYSLKPPAPSTPSSNEHPGDEKAGAGEDETDARRYVGWRGPGPSRPLPPIPSTRRDSSERRRRDRADAEAVDLGSMRRQNEARQSEEEVVEDGEWTVLDENPMGM